MYVGTPVVAVILWSVNTDSTEELNVGFFEQLTKVQQPAKALQATKLEMLRGNNERYLTHSL